MTRKAAIREAARVATPLVLLVFVAQASGQSGRRASKPPSTPQSPTTSLPQPESTENANSASKPSAGGRLSAPVKLLVATQLTSKHFASEDAIAAAFVKRLNEFSDVSAAPLGNLKRDEAVKRARAEADAFVVCLQFDIDSFQDGTIILNSQSLEVKYSLLAPHSGKQRTKGKVYFQPIGSGRMRKSNWPTGTPIKMTSEAAGMEAAELLYYSLAITMGVKKTQ
jgi:hypothetical protein